MLPFFFKFLFVSDIFPSSPTFNIAITVGYCYIGHNAVKVLLSALFLDVSGVIHMYCDISLFKDLSKLDLILQ